MRLTSHVSTTPDSTQQGVSPQPSANTSVPTSVHQEPTGVTPKSETYQRVGTEQTSAIRLSADQLQRLREGGSHKAGDGSSSVLRAQVEQLHAVTRKPDVGTTLLMTLDPGVTPERGVVTRVISGPRTTSASHPPQPEDLRGSIHAQGSYAVEVQRARGMGNVFLLIPSNRDFNDGDTYELCTPAATLNAWAHHIYAREMEESGAALPSERLNELLDATFFIPQGVEQPPWLPADVLDP